MRKPSPGLSNLINPATTEDKGIIITLFFKRENLGSEGLGNLSDTTEETEPGFESWSPYDFPLVWGLLSHYNVCYCTPPKGNIRNL